MRNKRGGIYLELSASKSLCNRRNEIASFQLRIHTWDETLPFYDTTRNEPQGGASFVLDAAKWQNK